LIPGHHEQVFGEYTITEIKNYGELTPILLRGNNAELGSALKHTYVRSPQGSYYPLDAFVKPVLGMGYKSITADRSGIFQSVIWNRSEDIGRIDEEDLMDRLQGTFDKTQFN
jgi:multidrug efflux pump subunit AcrB